MRFLGFLLLCAFSLSSWAEELVATTALDGKVSLLVPAGFKPFSQDMLELKYPSSRRPTQVLGNPTGTVTLAFNHTRHAVQPSQTKLHTAIKLRQMVMDAVHGERQRIPWQRCVAVQTSQIGEQHTQLSKFPRIRPQWIRDEVIEQNGVSFIVLELIMPAIDTQIHNIIYGTYVDDHLLMVAFNTTEELSETWLPIGRKIMASIAIR